ncbi:lactose-binding lectin l-2-like [Limanda limanda]|uniref:lactose-binding lectin l-2-like n=1 Tax=Limanda limanda TaxID=27771 RepID=UPI0029C68D1A|nr:lactose-binding lectin l-2-like [Limanda limanda]
MILLLLLFTLGAVSPSDGTEAQMQRGNCPSFWSSFNNRCYKYVATPMTWANAELYCLSQGANLVSIHSLDEQNFVKVLIKSFDIVAGRTWIGLNDLHKEGKWMWSDGSALDFTFWSPGQPDNRGNEDCVQTNYNAAKKWNDKDCSGPIPSVCASHIIYPQ